MSSSLRAHRQQGQVLVFFALLLPILAGLLALMIDIGGAAITYHRAQVALDSAAFAAAQGVSAGRLDAEQRTELDFEGAQALAGTYANLNARGALTITSFEIHDDLVLVSGQMIYRTLLGEAFGVPVIRARVFSSASPGFGISSGGQ
jgi:hypothetical protein